MENPGNKTPVQRLKAAGIALDSQLDQTIKTYFEFNKILKNNPALHSYMEEHPGFQRHRPPADSPVEQRVHFCLKTIQDRFANYLQGCRGMQTALSRELETKGTLEGKAREYAGLLIGRLKSEEAFFAESGVKAMPLLDEMVDLVAEMQSQGKATQEEADDMAGWRDRFVKDFTRLKPKAIIFSTIFSEADRDKSRIMGV